MSVKKYYFPPVGFGFWYQLGVLNIIPKNETSHFYGSSAGSIVCFLSLLQDEDRTFEYIYSISEKIRKDGFSLNYYYYLDKFLKQILIQLQTYSNEYITEKLKNVFIEVSHISFQNGIQRKFKNPKTLLELRDYVIASCYVPFVFFYKNPICYTIHQEYYFDGFFGGFGNVCPKTFTKINSYQFGSLIPRSKTHNFRLYTLGKKYDWKQMNQNFNIGTFFLITKNIFVDLLFYIKENVSSIYNKTFYNC